MNVDRDTNNSVKFTLSVFDSLMCIIPFHPLPSFCKDLRTHNYANQHTRKHTYANQKTHNHTITHAQTHTHSHTRDPPDGSGELDKDELQHVLHRIGFELDADRMADIMAVFDVDGAGMCKIRASFTHIPLRERRACALVCMRVCVFSLDLFLLQTRLELLDSSPIQASRQSHLIVIRSSLQSCCLGHYLMLLQERLRKTSSSASCAPRAEKPPNALRT